jgi:Mg-chelatase subunit ChlD
VDGAAFDENATGTALVGASWNGMSKTISITYRNYPYLRVETEVSPMTIQVNDTIEVTVRVIGDGYSLISKPIDVVLVTDRSGSMLYDTPDRMYSVREAAKQFINEMTPRDRVGLVSFGMSGSISRPGVNSRISTSEINNAYHYPTSYSAYATLDQALSIDLSGAKTKLDYMVPDYGTPMREAVRLSISHEITNARTNAVKAIILLSDGDYNFYGDPLARGTGSTSSTPSDFTDLTTKYYQYTYLNASNQNMSAYAKNNNIKIYAIGFAADISNGGKNTLRILAESTGGKYYDGNAANIETIYKNIAGELKNSAAALNTEMVLDFESLNVTYNEITTLVPGKDVFSYQYVEGISTKITSWNTTINPLPDHVPSYPYTVDQTTGWDQNPPQLKFSIGNISINQTWQATFLLQAKQPGNIDIFGSNSSVTFFGATMKYHVPIPASYATVLGEFIAEDNHPYFLSLDGLPSSGEICMGSQDLEYRWVLNYSGDRAVVQEIYYQRSENGQIWAGDWIHHSTVDAGTGPINGTVFGVQLDTRDRIGYYKVKVVAKEDCTGGLEAEWVASPSHIKTCGSIRIS